jgi:hypothetical protein
MRFKVTFTMKQLYLFLALFTSVRIFLALFGIWPNRPICLDNLILELFILFLLADVAELKERLIK